MSSEGYDFRIVKTRMWPPYIIEYTDCNQLEPSWEYLQEHRGGGIFFTLWGARRALRKLVSFWPYAKVVAYQYDRQ